MINFNPKTIFQVAVAITIISIISTSAIAQKTTAEQHARDVAKLFKFWDRDDRPGVAVGIARDGKVIMARGFGIANLEHAIPISADTVFRTGSVGKQFTAASAAILIEDGRLKLSDNIRTYIPEMPDYETPVSIQHLVHHTSGYRDYLGLQQLAGRGGAYYYTPVQVIDLLSRQQALNFEPGSQYLYSNSGYFLLAEIVARASGQSLDEFATARIFEPLGMSNSHYHDDHTRIVPNRADGYSKAGGNWTINMTKLNMVGDGGVFSTANDMLRWNEAIIASRLGKEDALLPDTLFQTPPLSDGSDSNYAYGLKVSEYRGLPTIGHGGAFVGFRSGNLVFPEQGFSVVVLANLSGIEPSRFCERIADIYLEDQLQPNTRTRNTRSRDSNSAAPSNATESIQADNLQEFSATYISDELNAAYRILNRDGELTVEILETRAVPEALEAVAPDSFRSSRSAFSFSRDKQGNIAGFILDSGRVKGLRFDRQSK